MNESNKTKPIVTRPPPPIPKTTTTVTDDLFLIDFSDSSPAKIEANHSLEQLSTIQFSPPTTIEPSQPLPQVQQRFSNNSIDAHRFVAQVVTGVTEQLKLDFPRSNNSNQDFTPPLVRRFTVPYPSTYYNIQRPQ